MFPLVVASVVTFTRKRVSARQARALSRRRWDEVAQDWDRFVEEGHDYHRRLGHGPALLTLIGRVRGVRVLDVGCGQGWFSRALARRGAKVTGVDWSKGMLELARRHEQEEPLGIRYVHGDVTGLDRVLGPQQFDLVTSCMALMDVPDPGRGLKAISRLLSSRARLVFSIPHPFNDASTRWSNPRVGHHGPRLVDHYFDEGPFTLDWKLRGTSGVMRAPQWHRTMTTWSRYLRDGGFAITRLEEPRISAALAQREPRLEGGRRVPYYLVLEARRLPARQSGSPG